MQTILVTGSDPDLLLTRAMVLNLATPYVVSALPHQVDDWIASLFTGHAVAVVVICHTLADQHPKLCRKIHALAPHIRIVLLQRNEGSESFNDDRCVLLPSGAGPAVLLQTVRRALQQSVQ